LQANRTTTWGLAWSVRCRNLSEKEDGHLEPDLFGEADEGACLLDQCCVVADKHAD
jgi:hypothetical protein